MIKEQVQLKKCLSVEDKITLTKELSRQHFLIDEKGIEQFAPYLAEIALITYFFAYCVEGVTFTYETDTDGTKRIEEDIYAQVSADEELMALYHNFFSMTAEEAYAAPCRLLFVQMESILNDVNRMVENKRQELIHKREDVVADFLGYLRQFLGSIDMAQLTSQLEEVIKYAKLMEPSGSVAPSPSEAVNQHED